MKGERGKSGSEDGGRAERQESWDSFGRWVVGFVWKNRIEVVQSKNALSKRILPTDTGRIFLLRAESFVYVLK